MKASALSQLVLSVVLAAGCSSGAGKSTPGGGGDMGTGGAAAGTTGGAGPDAAAGRAGGAAPDAAAGGGGGPPDAAFDVPVGPGITIIQEDQPGFAAVDGKVYPRQGSTNVIG